MVQALEERLGLKINISPDALAGAIGAAILQLKRQRRWECEMKEKLSPA